MIWRDAVIAGLGLSLATIYFFHWIDPDLKAQKIKQNYEDQIKSLGEELAEKQFELKHATYFIIGMPSDDPEYNGFPVCNLGCMDYSINGVNVRGTFIDSYNKTLDRLVKQSSKK